jgi:hypothetical protein
LALDHFTGVNLDRLASHDLDIDQVGNGWVEVSGQWEIFGNELRETLGNLRVAAIDVGASDVAIQAKLVQPDSADAGLIGRLTDANNYILLVTNAITGNFVLWKDVNGSYTQLDSVAHIFAAGEVIRLQLSGDSIQGYIDDVLLVEATDAAHQTVSAHGFFSHAGGFGQVRWDDFQVMAL